MLKKMKWVVVLFGFLLVTPVQAKTLISIGGAPAGGAWYLAAGVLADIFNKYVPEVQATAQVTGGAVQNINLLGTKKQQLGMCINTIALSAYEGRKPFKKKFTNIRTLYSSFSGGCLQVFAMAGSDLEYVSDLKGKKVMVGPPGHGSLVRLREIFPVLGFTFDDITPVYLPYGQAMRALGDKKLDATVLYMPYPALPAREFGMTNDIKLLRLKEENIKAIMAKFSKAYKRAVVPKDTYRGQNYEVPTVSTPNGLYVDAGLSDELVYKMTKAIFNHIDMLRASHPSVKDYKLEDAPLGALVPFHPGAIRYYKEAGVWPK